MPWKEQSTVEARSAFIDAYLTGDYSITELCSAHGISRQTGYKWLKRYDEEGRAGLVDRSRAPQSSSLAVAPKLVDLVIAMRKKHPRWGPRKLKVLLEASHPHLPIPAASTIGSLLKRNGLVLPVKPTRRAPPYPSPLEDYEEPNHIWCADFKGTFKTGQQSCSPLTITDGHTRYLLCCEALTQTDVSVVTPLFERCFKQFGMPTIIRTDNGPPFASRALRGLSQLSIWWMKLGIRHERIQPGKPTQNGRHERMHLTLKLEACSPPARTRAAQQRCFDHFRFEYNDVRPHEALGYQTPAAVYERSARRYVLKPLRLEYTAEYDVRTVRSNGQFKWKGKFQYVSETFRGERIGLKWDSSCGAWSVELGTILLGHISPGGSFRRLPDQRRRTRR